MDATIEYYQTDKGKSPFIEWFESLRLEDQITIENYIRRVLFGGSKKNVKHLREGVFEIKIHKGPGHRIYFGMVNNQVILLLVGGNKRTQEADIKKAVEYWRDYVTQK